MPYRSWNGDEIEDAEMDAIRAQAREQYLKREREQLDAIIATVETRIRETASATRQALSIALKVLRALQADKITGDGARITLTALREAYDGLSQERAVAFDWVHELMIEGPENVDFKP